MKDTQAGNVMKDRRKIIFLLMVGTVFMLSLGWIICAVVFNFTAQKILREKSRHQVTDFGTSFKELWVQPDIALSDEIHGGPGIFAENEIIYFIGKIPGIEGIIALNASNPDMVVWHRGLSLLNYPGNLFVNLSGLYTGTAGDIDVTAYDLQTGKTKWRTSLRNPPVKGLEGLYETGGKVYVDSNYNFVLDSRTGEILANSTMQLTSEDPFSHIFFRARGIFRGEISYDWYPGSTTITAIDNSRKDLILWEVNGVAGNPVFFNNTIYYLTTDGRVVGVNADTGKFIHSLKFDKPAFGSLAVDQSTGIIYVWLQDSNQLFAFKIIDTPGN